MREEIKCDFSLLFQIIFLVLLFAYMVAMMFIKWILYSSDYTDFAYSPGCAPSILNLFINMMLFKVILCHFSSQRKETDIQFCVLSLLHRKQLRCRTVIFICSKDKEPFNEHLSSLDCFAFHGCYLANQFMFCLRVNRARTEKRTAPFRKISK